MHLYFRLRDITWLGLVTVLLFVTCGDSQDQLQKTIDEIRAAGADVMIVNDKTHITIEYDSQFSKPTEAVKFTHLLTMIARLSGAVRHVKLSGIEVDDDTMVGVGHLPNLETIELIWTSVTDSGIKHLKKCKGLKSITARGNRIAGVGFSELATLESLYLTEEITNDGIAAMSTLKQVRELELIKSQIDDVGLRHLAGMQKLRSLTLLRNNAQGKSLRAFRGLRQVTALKVSDSINDAGLSEIGSLTQLQRLVVIDATISDVGVANLAPLANLRSLEIAGGPELSNKGFTWMNSLKDLNFLQLSGKNISGDILENIPAPSVPTRDLLCRLINTNVQDEDIAAWLPNHRRVRIEKIFVIQ